MTAEDWRDVPGAAIYQASDKGRVRSLRHGRVRILKTRPHRGYPHVTLTVAPGRLVKTPVHRLVLLAFKGSPPPGRNITRHLDGSRTNNHPDNLAWGTPTENAQDAIRHGTAACRRTGGRSPAAKLNDVRYAELATRVRNGERAADLATEFNVHETYVHMIRRGRGRGRGVRAVVPTGAGPSLSA